MKDSDSSERQRKKRDEVGKIHKGKLNFKQGETSALAIDGFGRQDDDFVSFSVKTFPSFQSAAWSLNTDSVDLGGLLLVNFRSLT